MSAVLPAECCTDLPRLTSMGAIAVCESLRELHSFQAVIKWPNDVLVSGRKIAGILVELCGPAILGVGLNVNQCDSDFPPETRLPPTSAKMETGAATDRVFLAARVLAKLDRMATAGEGADDFWRRWERLAERIEGDVTVATNTGDVRGDLVDFRPDRGLTLRTADGTTRHLPAHAVLRVESKRRES
jgi:BirA family biotin operon repressor/biotin-[acetyl-CoA-carboxylase] ligase